MPVVSYIRADSLLHVVHQNSIVTCLRRALAQP